MQKNKDHKNIIKLSAKEIHTLQERLGELEQVLHSIQCGEVDALIIQDKKGETQVFTLEGTDQPYRILVESMSEGAITLTGEGIVLHCNKQFSKMVNTPSKNIIGSSFYKYMPEIERDSFKDLLSKGKIQSCKGEFSLQTKNGSTISALLSCHNLEFGNIDGISIVATDITEISKMHKEVANSLKEKEAMLKEIYHRVKNNLQVIASLLNLQAKSIADIDSRNIFIESVTRVKSMALVHEMLYQSGNLSQIEMGKYVNTLSKTLADIYHIYNSRVKILIDADSIFLSIENAIPYGLIINELISNAFKHAFPADKPGQITISIKHKDDIISLCVHDNGVGFPAHIDFQNTTTLGMQLIHTLTKQLRGNITLDRSSGTKFTLDFSTTFKE